jgi:HAD superfamily hydrolase (TIGR01490 family)
MIGTPPSTLPLRPEGALCFFDMDKTLIAGNSGVSFMRYSLLRKKTSRWKVYKAMLDYFRYRLDLLDMPKAYRQTLRDLIGVREEELVQFCQEWFEDAVKGMIYPQARDFLNRHMDQGDVVIIISNSTNYAVEPLARHLGVPYVLATRLEVRDGVFTGEYLEPLCYGQGKIYWAEKLAGQLGKNLGEGIFYSDSITDLPLLERVRHPRVVNPDLRLRAIAKRRGWPIQTFRLKG